MSQEINREAEGLWPCTILHGTFGEDEGSPQVQVHARMDEGPRKGRVFVYEDQVNSRSALYIQRSCRTIGWTGVSLTTLKQDIAAWVAKTGGKTTGEIKVIEVKKGRKFDEWVAGGMEGERPAWEKLNSFGRGARPLTAATPERLKDADEAMRAAMRDDGFEPRAGGASPDDAPPNPGPNDEDLPFIHRGDVVAVARIIR